MAECTKIARFSAVAAAIFTAPLKIARFFEAPRCAVSSAKKIASEPRFLLRIKWVKMVLAAEFPAIPSPAAKIASEWRCAILVHSVAWCFKQGGGFQVHCLIFFIGGSLFDLRCPSVCHPSFFFSLLPLSRPRLTKTYAALYQPNRLALWSPTDRYIFSGIACNAAGKTRISCIALLPSSLLSLRKVKELRTVCTAAEDDVPMVWCLWPTSVFTGSLPLFNPARKLLNTNIYQGRKRNPNLNFLVRIFSGGVGVFHVKGWGPKSSVCPSKPRETKLFWRGIPGFSPGYPGGARKV